MNAAAVRQKVAKVFHKPLSSRDDTIPKGRRMKRKVVKKQVYLFTPQELTVIEEGLLLGAMAARRDIEHLNGADAATLEPHIARAVRLEQLYRRVFKKR